MVDYNQLAYVENSSYRVDVVSELLDKPQTPSSIAEQTDKEMAHISRAITELADKDITELKVDEDVKRGRIYGLTDSGESVATMVKERQA